MDKRIKAQVAIEFAIMIAFVFLAFLIFLKVIAGQLTDISKEKEYNELKDITEKIQSEIFVAKSSKEGYSREFKIPLKINNRINYDIILNNELLYLKTERYQHAVNIPNITGVLQKGTNQIRKVDGILILN